MERSLRSKESAPTNAEGLRAYLEAREGSALRAWLRHFDRDNDKRARKHEFYVGCNAIGYTGDVATLFATLDQDHSGELGLDEIDSEQAALWDRFCAWCVANFDSAAHLVSRVSRQPSLDELTLEQFTEGLHELGWTEGSEELLFSALDAEGTQRICQGSFRWLDQEKRRIHRKNEAKRRCVNQNLMRTERRRKAIHLTQEFRTFLLRKYGDYLRAWRVALNPSGSMNLRKMQFLKSCAKLGWQAASHMIWETLDKDDSGTISLDELDLKTVELLASFHALVMERFGSAAAAFRGIDESNSRQVRLHDFTRALQKLGFTRSARQLFHGLDRDGSKVVTEDEFLFLDHWKPQPYLLASPNDDAMKEWKELLLDRYSNYLKAWRHLIDQDGTNRCNWGEFQDACATLHFSGDSAGAWRALDADLSGYITLEEVDPDSFRSLVAFRKWADTEFGCVKSAFQVFDLDGSNQVTKSEFCRCCRIYRYNGDASRLFHALDVDREGTLCREEVAFLDDWELEDVAEEAHEGEHPTRERRRSTLGHRMTLVLQHMQLEIDVPQHAHKGALEPLEHPLSSTEQQQALVDGGRRNSQPRVEQASELFDSSPLAATQESTSSSRVLTAPDAATVYSMAPSMRMLKPPRRRTPRRQATPVEKAFARPSSLPPLCIEDILDVPTSRDTPSASAEWSPASPSSPFVDYHSNNVLGAVLGLAPAFSVAKRPQNAATWGKKIRNTARGNCVSVERALATYAVPGLPLGGTGTSSPAPVSARRAGGDGQRAQSQASTRRAAAAGVPMFMATW